MKAGVGPLEIELLGVVEVGPSEGSVINALGGGAIPPESACIKTENRNAIG